MLVDQLTDHLELRLVTLSPQIKEFGNKRQGCCEREAKRNKNYVIYRYENRGWKWVEFVACMSGCGCGKGGGVMFA